MTKPTPHGQVPEALLLADQYAAAHAKWALEDLYGSSKSYTAEKLAERHAARAKLERALHTQQPASPTPPAEQQAAPKAAQYEMDKEASNVRLDIDSNSTKPEQQRDVACSLEVGQHVGNGEHQGASCRGSEDSELLKIAARNIKYFIEHAQFSSFADKRAALNCLDALAAPPEEQAAPKAAPGDAIDEAMRERDDAEDFIDALLDEVLGHERPEWSSSYGRADALNDVQERMTALHKPAVDKAWGQFQSAMAAPQQEAQEPVAWLNPWRADQVTTDYDAYGERGIPLYTAPQPAPAPLIARSLAEWHEDDGFVAWWAWNGREWAGEPAWIGNPNCEDWPGYHTHWTPHPDQPVFSALAAQGGKT